MTSPIANIKPSTRDLAQFVSPNANSVSRLIQMEEASLLSEENLEKKLQAYEDDEISALILGVESGKPNWSALQKPMRTAENILSCPLILMCNLTKREDLVVSRNVGFDAQITPLSMTDRDLTEWHTLAQAMHLRLIFIVNDKNDWERIEKLSPRFVFVKESNAWTQELSKRVWTLGPIALRESLPLKGVIETKV